MTFKHKKLNHDIQPGTNEKQVRPCTENSERGCTGILIMTEWVVRHWLGGLTTLGPIPPSDL